MNFQQQPFFPIRCLLFTKSVLSTPVWSMLLIYGRSFIYTVLGGRIVTRISVHQLPLTYCLIPYFLNYVAVICSVRRNCRSELANYAFTFSAAYLYKHFYSRSPQCCQTFRCNSEPVFSFSCLLRW